jgi:hypothetical protein
MTTIKDVIDEFNRVKDMWNTADWRHVLDTGNSDDQDDDPVYCTGDTPWCQTCVQATEESRLARGYAEQACDVLQLGDTHQAAYLARRAADTENEWGDAPTWGKFCRMVEELDNKEWEVE